MQGKLRDVLEQERGIKSREKQTLGYAAREIDKSEGLQEDYRCLHLVL